MTNPGNELPKNSASKLHVLNLVIALIAGLISIVGGVYSLKNNYFSPQTGSLWGVVRDESIAKPLWLAPVEISETAGSGVVVATINTDQSGKYTLDGLREGDYTVTVSAPRHKTQTKMVKIYAKTNATVNFDLIPEEPKPEIPLSETPVVPQTVAKPNYPAQPQASSAHPYESYSNPSSDAPTGRRGRHRRSSASPYSNTGDTLNNSSPYGNTTDPYSNSGYQTNSNSGAYGTSNSYGSQSPATPQNTLAQAVGQLIQGYVAKKSGSQTSTQ